MKILMTMVCITLSLSSWGVSNERPTHTSTDSQCSSRNNQKNDKFLNGTIEAKIEVPENLGIKK